MNIKWPILMVAGFMAAFVDAVAGGGGVISVPAFFMAGFPSHFALGTNKFSMSMGSSVSTLNYYKSGKVDKKLMYALLPFSLIGSVLGVFMVLRIDATVLEPLVMLMLIAVGLYSMFSKSIGVKDTFKGFSSKNLLIGIIFALVLGFYDGFFGPGTGSFIIFGLIKIYGFDFVRASGNAKALNLMSNVSALITFALNGKIIYIWAIPTAIVMMLGGYIGSKVALKGGAKFIKPVFVGMALAAALKMLLENL